ncbi:MAG: hypothetical protein ACYC21_15985 [Eubacteriales bacterium]
MLLVWSGMLLTWVFALAGWVFVSTFIHELFHLLSARLNGLGIKDYRLFSIPGGVKGYVDVIIAGGTANYSIKKGLLHLSGIIAHLFLVGILTVMWHLSWGTLFKGVLLIGIVINFYFIMVNVFPEDSDGRQFWHMVKKEKGD